MGIKEKKICVDIEKMVLAKYYLLVEYYLLVQCYLLVQYYLWVTIIYGWSNTYPH